MVFYLDTRTLRRPSAARTQRGLVRIEAIAALVLFLIGVLAIVGLQMRSAQTRTEATFRAQAAQHAAELVAEMRTTAPAMRDQVFGSGPRGLRYLQWLKKMQAGPVALPGTQDHPPTVNVVQNEVDNGDVRLTVAEVTVTIYWQQKGNAVHQYVTTVRIPDPVT